MANEKIEFLERIHENIINLSISARIKKKMMDQTDWVKVGFTDIDGVFRGKMLHQKKIESISNLGVCDVVFGWDLHDKVYPTDSLSGWKKGFPDGKATIDEKSKRIGPDGRALYIMDFRNDLILHQSCPRTLLSNLLAEYKKIGLTVKVGYEYEWFNFNTTEHLISDPAAHSISTGMYGYSLHRLSQQSTLIEDLLSGLKNAGITIEGFHTETGPGVYEAAILYDEALRSADNAALFKYLVKTISRNHGILASFMAKWNKHLPGCSGHIHISIENQKGQKLSFSKPKEDLAAASFMEGVLGAMPDLLPLYAPFVNSYKRLVPGSWAPTGSSWGIQNRTASVRVIPGNSERLELRIPGADANPYLALYACLASGLYGMQMNLPLFQTEPVDNAYLDKDVKPLPKNLRDATQNFVQSEMVARFMNQIFIDHYAMTRFHEWNEYGQAITDWELKRYLEIV